jgi:hypothetical protein
MRHLLHAIKLGIKGIFKYRTLLPKTFVILFTVTNAIIIGFQQGFKEGMMVLAKTLLMAELIIQQNVTLAINNDPSYNLFAFMQIINACLVLYILIKIIVKVLLVGFTGSQAPFSSYLVAIIIVGIIEMAAIGWFEHTFFIPIWDGIIYLLLNLGAVISNIHWWSYGVPETPAITNPQNETMNNPLETIV